MTLERWKQLTKFEQLSNIGADIKRALDNPEYGDFYLEKARKLIDMTAQDPKNGDIATELYDELNEAKNCLQGLPYATYDYVMRYWNQYDDALAVLGPKK